MTQAGPVDLPGDSPRWSRSTRWSCTAGTWPAPPARTTTPGEAAILACLGFAQSFEPPADADDGGLFGPPVAVPDDAPALDRLAGATGRDPRWTPPAA